MKTAQEYITEYNATHNSVVTHVASNTDCITLYAVTECVVYVRVYNRNQEEQELTLSLDVFNVALARNDGSCFDIVEVQTEPTIEQLAEQHDLTKYADDSYTCHDLYMTDLDRLQHDLQDAQSLLKTALETEALYATYSNTSKRVLKVRRECAEDVHKYQLLVTRIETSIAEEEAVTKLPTCDADLLSQYIESEHGEVVVDFEQYTRPELVRLAHALNNWNANQPISDHAHNVHYVTYVHPINMYLDGRI